MLEDANTPDRSSTSDKGDLETSEVMRTMIVLWIDRWMKELLQSKTEIYT